MSAVVSFEDSVKQKLKTIVADLIPEDRYEAIVRATVQDFERNDLPKLVRAELEAKYREAIRAEFDKPEWKGTWSATAGPAASEAVKQLIVDAAPLVLSSMIGGATQQIVSQLQYALQNPVRY